jgi:glyoxylase-like metal-dependent hydrolase (beta-lactamase superfamily II)
MRLDPAHGRVLTPRSRPNLAGRRWRVIATPGHTPDHLSFLDAAGGVLVGGDLLLRLLPTHHELSGYGGDRRAGTERLDELLGSWRRVSRLAVDAVLPGHGPPVRAPRVLIARRIASVQQRLRVARSAVRGGAETVWDVTLALDPAVPEPPALPARVGESVALLEWLRAKGVVSRERRGATAVYVPAARPPGRPIRRLGATAPRRPPG